MNTTRFAVMAAVLAVALPAAGQAPYVFAPGTPAKAFEVNANFDYLAEQISTKVDVFTALGHGNEPSIAPVYTFWAPTATVTVTDPSQKMLVLSMKVVGTEQASGSGYWSINICYRNTNSTSMVAAIASPSNPFPDWTPYFVLPQGAQLPLSLSAVVSSLPPGTYEVGLCGQPVSSPSTNTILWNAEGANGYTNVVFLN